MTIYETKQQMYVDYCLELNQYRVNHDADMSKEDALDTFHYYVNTDLAKWVNVFDGDELAGFLIIGKEEPEKHPEADYDISQAYVRPEYRRKGLMTKAVSRYLFEHPGKVSLHVLEDNEYALRYWPWLFEELGYVSYPVEQAPVTSSGDRFVCFGWEPQSNEEE